MLMVLLFATTACSVHLQFNTDGPKSPETGVMTVNRYSTDLMPDTAYRIDLTQFAMMTLICVSTLWQLVISASYSFHAGRCF